MFEKLLARDERQMRLMRAMMDRLNVDPVAAAQRCFGSLFVGAVRACRSCGETEACRRWLENPQDREPSFCPNVAFFREHPAQANAAATPAPAACCCGSAIPPPP